MSKVFTITEGLENLGALRTGGQGSVYKGKRMGAIYSAVKLIPTPIHTEDRDDKNYRNFENEVSKLLKVNENPSPNVVKMLSFGITESGSFPFIEMEYIEGPDLCELLQPPHQKIFTLNELIKVARHLAAALEHCHKLGVKHGDVKSNNVKYNVHTANYVLLDFGLAIMSEEQRRSSIRHAGAVEFMAPEQNEGKMLLQTDVYSYGIILYELLGGEVPFPLPGNSDTGRNLVMIGHMENEVPNVVDLRKTNLPASWTDEQKTREMQVPDWLLKLIDKCLQKDPMRRYSDGMALHEAVVSGSLSGIKLPIDNAAMDLLKTENEALRKQVLALENVEQSPDKKGILLPHFAFAFLIISIIGLMAFLGYSQFGSKPQAQEVLQPIDSIPTAVDTPMLDRKRLANQRRLAEAAATKRMVDSAINAEIKKARDKAADSTEDLKLDTSASPIEF
ncbi:serine/threonine protein kinase [Pedobacter psychrodurus]|uniref:Serine/threonine protein kinase n=1 Tax=Pedobacter psychrodurus TaxID=2530456 RepID=A0A4R0Q6Q1_9SPHI|nr:serine/threonine-protein kinase [Pedobacter psychrodurus]TCD28535.1 serine/threonine protein kinase [Pedobacter psychrodurus]